MNLIAMKDLKEPRRLKERLLAAKELLLTSDGRPVAIMLHVESDDDPTPMLDAVRDARSRLALSRVREAARQKGSARLSSVRIEREIAAARAARRSGR